MFCAAFVFGLVFGGLPNVQHVPVSLCCWLISLSLLSWVLARTWPPLGICQIYDSFAWHWARSSLWCLVKWNVYICIYCCLYIMLPLKCAIDFVGQALGLHQSSFPEWLSICIWACCLVAIEIINHINISKYPNTLCCPQLTRSHYKSFQSKIALIPKKVFFFC